jgi:hypothetical protein
LRVFLGILALILIIVGWYVAFYVMPKATVTIKTDTSNIQSDIDLVASPKTPTLDVDNKVVPALNKELKKTDTEKVQATGEKDMGTKATGEVTLSTLCSPTFTTVPAGTGVSTGNLTFITQADVTLDTLDSSGGNCRLTGDVKVTSQNAGDKYNISSGRTFTVSGYSSVSGTNADGMSGGTSKIVKVVSQKDLDDAKQKLLERSLDTAKQDIKDDLKETGYIGFDDSFNAGTPVVTSTPKVGEEATDVTVTSVTTFSMVGVKKEDLQKLIEKSVDGKIDKSKQEILDNGLDKASFRLTEKKPNGDVVIAMQVTVTAGPHLDADDIKREVAGKKKGQAIEIVQTRPGIKEVNITYSPSWVSSIPKKVSKIKVVFESSNTNDATDNR